MNVKIKSKFQLKLRKLRVEAKKKHERFLQNECFYHWASFNCNYLLNLDKKSD